MTLPRVPSVGAALVLVLTWGGDPGVSARGGDAAELRPETVAAFNRYVLATERDHQSTREPAGRFLQVDRLPAAEREVRLGALRRGEIWIERLETRDGDRGFRIPGGQVHHWSGTVFLPGVSLEAAVRLLQDYDRHAAVYAPAVVRSQLVERQGDTFVVDLRFYQKHVIAVTLDTRNDARFTRHGGHRASSRIVSTRVNEVEHAGTAEESARPEGQDSGYLWRLNTYWRFHARDGGTYLECESITLTRSVPTGLGWLIGRYVNSIPRETLTFTLERTRDTLTRVQARR